MTPFHNFELENFSKHVIGVVSSFLKISLIYILPVIDIQEELHIGCTVFINYVYIMICATNKSQCKVYTPLYLSTFVSLLYTWVSGGTQILSWPKLHMEQEYKLILMWPLVKPCMKEIEEKKMNITKRTPRGTRARSEYIKRWI